MNNYFYDNISSQLGTEQFFTSLASSLPAVFTRETASKCMGGILSAKTLTNLDVAGNGPSVRVRIGNKVAYERDNFILWLRNKFSAR
jgi:hypothetical protein